MKAESLFKVSYQSLFFINESYQKGANPNIILKKGDAHKDELLPPKGAFMSQKTRNVDVVFCIDGSATMAPVMEGVKAMVKKFHSSLVEFLQGHNDGIGSFRAKLIVFRDYGVDAMPVDVTPWFNLHRGEETFHQRLDDIVARGGSESSNGFEALYLAERSSFVSDDHDRQIIVLITNADAIEMGARASSPKYPSEMGNLVDLVSMWMGLYDADPELRLRNRCHRLIIFAPEGAEYEKLTSILDSSQFIPMPSKEELLDFDWDGVFRIKTSSPR